MRERPAGRLGLVLAAVVLLGGCVTVLEDGSGFEWGWEPAEDESEQPLWTRIRSGLERHDPDAARAFWSTLFSALQGHDLERLAQVADWVQWVSERAAWVPGVAEHRDWLDARSPYFEAARQARATQRPPPAPRPRRSEDGRRPPPRQPSPPPPEAPDPVAALPRLPPPPATALTPLPASVSTAQGRPVGPRREEVRTGREYWRERLTRQPVPPRATPLLPAMRAAFRAEGVPEAWVWIAEVESSMNPEARSPAGAVGLFQLMPRTATSLGLSLSPNDERLDAGRNATAAAHYLRSLHQRFGSWPLALAAYNAGQGRVAGLCRRHGQTFDTIAEHLPLETRMYVPRVLETVRARTGIDPETLPPPDPR